MGILFQLQKVVNIRLSLCCDLIMTACSKLQKTRKILAIILIKSTQGSQNMLIMEMVDATVSEENQNHTVIPDSSQPFN